MSGLEGQKLKYLIVKADCDGMLKGVGFEGFLV